MELQKISSAMLVLTHACNLRCRYCFVHQQPEHMTYDVALAAAKFLINNAEASNVTPHINFFGGEPTLMWDSIIEPLTNWIRNEYKKPFTLGITTNGTLLNDERMEFMMRNRISLLFSIDGDQATQDFNRPYEDGIGSFNSLKDIIPKIAKNFKGTTFRSTAIPPTCNHVFENIMFARRNGFQNFYVVPNVFEEWTDADKETLRNEMNKYADYYITSYKHGITPIEFSSLESAFKDIRKINAAINEKQYRKLRECSACGKCGLGSNRNASIHPNGNIFACQEMTSNDGEDSIFYIGNIYSGVDNDRRISLMNAFDAKDATGLNCNACKYNRICTGGCVANNYLINGDLTVNPPMFCWWQQIVLDIAIQIMQELGNEQNEVFRKKWSRQL